jgi:DNA/RNA endonuclease G (NUC1)
MSTGNLGRSMLLACALVFSGAAFAQNVRISEIHYDNTGTDSGEALEISAPAGTDLTGWQVVLYNAANGAPYDTRALSGTVPATCDTRGVVTLAYAVNGIQNGAPDGVALFDNTGALVEFLSYEGAFTAISGPAAGATSVDIGVSEQGTEPIGLSLARDSYGVWSGPAANTFGACNDGDPPPQAMVVRVTITPSQVSVPVGGTTRLIATAFDENDAPVPGAHLTWSSLNDGIASVSPTGVVTGNAMGGILVFAMADSGVRAFAVVSVTEAPPPQNSLSFSGRNSSDPALPAGFEDQLFATLRDPGGTTIPSAITWSSDTPDVATIDANGVVHALAAGTAVLRATADDGTTATWSLPTRNAVTGTAIYGNNAEFGEPADADASDDFIVRHEQYTASYNPNRGAPNWVAYDLDATHFGAEDRCDCFTADPSLPATFPHLTTNDYTGAGAAAGYGIDRGHLARSFDRTSGSLDNARTFFFDNIVPQAADLNQGPWAALENDLGDLARVQDKEVYIVTGAFGNKGTLKNEGKIVIPTHAWKVALILPRDRGLADIRDYRDVEAIAVLMPNEPGIRNTPWQTYQTTIDQIEAQSGYDLLALLPDKVEAAVESNTQPPLATLAGVSAAIAEGGSLTFSAAGSVDPNGSIVSYAWDFGDGTVGSGETASHVYAQDGTYTVRLTVTDNDGLTDTAMVAVSVTNVAPVLDAVPDGNVNLGTAYTVAGTFTDPGADTWRATVDWGDGSAPSTVTTATRSFSLTHTYAAADLYTVTVTVADDDTSVSRTHSVTVAQTSTGLADALKLIDKLVAERKIHKCLGVMLKAEVDAARKLIAKGNNRGAMTVLRTLVSELDFLVRMRMVKAADVAPLRALLIQVYQSLR